jgi:sugar phosphate permease
MLGGGLAVAVLCNTAMFFVSSVPVMTAIWALNGFAHAMLWPPMARMLSTNLTEEEYFFAELRIHAGSSGATIGMYLLIPLLIQFISWRYVMLSFAAVGAVVLLVWIIGSGKVLTSDGSIKKEEEAPKEFSPKPLPRYVWLPFAAIIVSVVAMGTLRDGINNWVPSFLLESFHMPEENAIFATVVLAIFSLVAYYTASWVQRKLIRNELLCSSVLFGISALAALALYIVNLFSLPSVVSLLLMAVTVACMHGNTLMFTVVVPKRFNNSGRVSTFAGLLNAPTYLGAALSTYGFAKLAEHFGWSFTLFSWFVVALIGAVLTALSVPLWQRFRREYDEVEG